MASSRSLTTITEADYDVIADAVMETARGRWFLAEFARRNRHADTTVLLEAIGRLEGAVTSGPGPGSLDRVRDDLMEMARAIARTKSEIAALHAPEQDQGQLGAASHTLDGIVLQTERATSDILEAAEHIQETAWTLRESGEDGGLCDELDRRATQIYTACSFQDLTAQRTGRIVGTMRYLETRLTAMIEIWGGDDAADPTAQTHSATPAFDLSQSDIDRVIDTSAAEQDLGPPQRRSVEPGMIAADDFDFVLDGEEPFSAPPPEGSAANVTALPAAQTLSAALADIDMLSVAEKLQRFT